MAPVFSYGLNCKDLNQIMRPIDLSTLIRYITDITSPLVLETKTLRKVYSYSKDSYRNMKTTLPYISCSTFEQGKRKYDHFIHSCGWVIDLDLPAQDQNLYTRLLQDDRITLLYTSPSGIGLKIILLFNKIYKDKILYSQAYKEFARSFGLQYGVLDYIDMKNCDVSRISFLCHDASCYYNPMALCIDPEDYHPHVKTVVPSTKIMSPEIAPTVYKEILHLLESKPRLTATAPHVPVEILQLMEPLQSFLLEHQIQMISHNPVQYGLKIRAKYQFDNGEVILYKGKKGFTVVTSARKDLHHELNDTIKQLITYFLHTIYGIW